CRIEELRIDNQFARMVIRSDLERYFAMRDSGFDGAVLRHRELSLHVRPRPISIFLIDARAQHRHCAGVGSDAEIPVAIDERTCRSFDRKLDLRNVSAWSGYKIVFKAISRAVIYEVHPWIDVSVLDARECRHITMPFVGITTNQVVHTAAKLIESLHVSCSICPEQSNSQIRFDEARWWLLLSDESRRGGFMKLSANQRKYRGIVREKHRIAAAACQIPHIRIHLALVPFEVDGHLLRHHALLQSVIIARRRASG